MNQNLFSLLKNVLLKNHKFSDQYLVNGHLNRPKIIDALENLDLNLLAAIDQDKYFKKLGYRHDVSSIQRLIKALKSTSYITDSFTNYTNTVGLASKSTNLNKFITYNNDIILNYPYKDCLLKAGMTKDKKQDIAEYMLNDIIDQSKLTDFRAPKLMYDAKRYDSQHPNGVRTNKFNPTDNLFIKGNNLEALYSLKDRYYEKIQMIYIDPPYNTGNDSFRYNDRFNQSVWLVFMKNRLDIAKDLLKKSGSIFISCDDNEQAYLKVLCDEIFGKENFIATITDVNNRKGNQDQFGFAKTHDYILVYVKDMTEAKKQDIFNKLPLSNKELKRWSKDSKGYYKRGANLKSSGDNAPRYKRPNLFYPIYISPDKKIHFQRHSDSDVKLLPRSNHQDMSWRWSKKRMADNLFDVIVNKSSRGYSLYKKQRDYKKKPKTLFDKPQYSSGNGTDEVKDLFHKKVFSHPKPEELIADLITIGTRDSHDIVLDFFAGSATTQAVAMKMHRRFIGVEQMDYTDSVSVPRLQKVIKGEQGGVSKENNWRGGGSFVYAKLMPYNLKLANYIKRHENNNQVLDELYQKIMAGEINVRINLSSFDKLNREKWRKLTDVKDKAIYLINMLDKNQIYRNYYDLNSSEVQLSHSDTKFNRSFYKED